MLQRFEFIKVCRRIRRFCWKSQFCLYSVDKIYLPGVAVLYFCCLPAPRGDLTPFQRVTVLGVSTAKRRFPKQFLTVRLFHDFGRVSTIAKLAN